LEAATKQCNKDSDWDTSLCVIVICKV
jgi:hypothetical protein